MGSEQRIFLVSDQPIASQGLLQILSGEPGVRVCGEAGELTDAMGGILEKLPDLVVVDFSRKPGDGIRLTQHLRSRYPAMAVLVLLSTPDQSGHGAHALRAGASGCVGKGETGETVLKAIRQVLSGSTFVGDEIERDGDWSPAPISFGGAPRPGDVLTPRQSEVFRLVGQGMSLREIASELRLSIKTIETHCAQIKKKFGLRTSRQLVEHAYLWFTRRESD